MPDLGLLQARLGYRFDSLQLLELALTHRSVGGEHNERLEFLGDSVLGFVIAEALYREFPRASEGALTRMRANLVRKPTLATIARELDLGRYVRLGSGELRSGGHDRDSILADSLEALIGAIYLDSDLETATSVLLRLFEKMLRSITPDIVKDPKTRLQELLQKQALELPVYEVVEQQGQQHQLRFVVECRAGEKGRYHGEGRSRREAEQRAALKAFEALS